MTIYEYLVDTADSSTVAVNVTVAVLQATHQVVREGQHSKITVFLILSQTLWKAYDILTRLTFLTDNDDNED